jgi:hypothetical protein
VYDTHLDDTDDGTPTGTPLFPGNPVYLFDMSTWYVAVLGKPGGGRWWYARTQDFTNSNQPLGKVAYWHSAYSVFCTNRQRNAIIYNPNP